MNLCCYILKKDRAITLFYCTDLLIYFIYLFVYFFKIASHEVDILGTNHNICHLPIKNVLCGNKAQQLTLDLDSFSKTSESSSSFNLVLSFSLQIL